MMNLDAIRQFILARLADADVRTDQCSIMRVYWHGRASFISESEDGFRVSVGLRPAPGTPDFLPDPSIVETAHDEMEAAHKLVHWLKRVEATDIDSPDAWQT